MSDDPGADRTFQYLVDAVTDYAIYMIDPGGCISSWNTGAHRLKGYAEQEVRGRHFAQFFTPEAQAQGVPEALLQEADKLGRVEAEGWRVRKDGSRFWARGAIHAVRDDAGVLIGFAKVTRDMTREREAQQALMESERRFRLLVQGVIDYAIFMVDPDGIVSNWNPGAQTIKGYTADQIVGQHISRFYTAEDQALGKPALALRTAAAQGRYEAEGWRVRRDGSLFWASVVIDAIHEDDGTLAGFAKVTRDITEKRQAQIDLQLAHEQLAQSQKLEALGKLTGGVAHDFNNLLMVVSGQSQLLRRKISDADPRAVRALDAIEAAARRGEELTRRLLSFSRRQRLTPEPMSLSERADELRQLLTASLPPTIDLQMSLGQDLWPVAADVGELELALINLAVNARDAMPDGGTLSIEGANVTLDAAGPEALAGDFVALTIRDTGGGIAPDILPKIFDPFFTTKDVSKGTGLGLSQVFGFAEQSGGRVAVDSALGGGTRFVLHLPRSHRTHSAVADPAPERGSAARILLVEDNPDVAEVAGRMLEALGHQVHCVGSGAAALSALKSGDPVDLIFSDIVMAGQPDGLGMAREARTLFPGLPVLLATGYSEAAARIGDEFPILRKPYKLEDLDRAIGRLSAGGLAAGARNESGPSALSLSRGSPPVI